MRAINSCSFVWGSAVAYSSILALNASSSIPSSATRASNSAIWAFFRRYFSCQRFRILFSNATEFLSTSRYSSEIRVLSPFTRRYAASKTFACVAISRVEAVRLLAGVRRWLTRVFRCRVVFGFLLFLLLLFAGILREALVQGPAHGDHDQCKR
jgi:hypothetical protein